MERGLAENIESAVRLVGAGMVLVDNRVYDKAGTLVDRSLPLRVKSGRRFVSRGGDKLNGCLDRLEINLQGYVCADIGASTGGFTDCLLQRGAAKIYCVDVGYGLLDWKLRQDDRVVVLERTNARNLTTTHIPEPLDLAVVDASFISLEPLLPPLLQFFRESVRILALVKPQFQLPRDVVGQGGLVHDSSLHQQALDMARQFGEALGLQCAKVVASSVLGAKGNQEFFMLFTGESVLLHDIISIETRRS